jgi:hypothetical protein
LEIPVYRSAGDPEATQHDAETVNSCSQHSLPEKQGLPVHVARISDDVAGSTCRQALHLGYIPTDSTSTAASRRASRFVTAKPGLPDIDVVFVDHAGEIVLS